MVTVLEVTLDTLADPRSLAALRAAAAEQALVLACQYQAITDSLTARLREALPRHQIVALSLASMSPDERDLIEQVIGAGMVALVTIRDDRMAVRLTGWLEAEITLMVPGEGRAA
jgi:hypothetical protein